MKLAVITDSPAYLPQHLLLHHDDLFILDIPIYIDGESSCGREESGHTTSS